MIRPPSNQRPSDFFFSGDTAIIQASEALPSEERDRLINVARETGDWPPVLVTGQLPTKFRLQPLRGEVHRTLLDMMYSTKIGPAMLTQLAFRAGVAGIENIGPDAPKFKIVKHDELGDVMCAELADWIDALNPKVIGEVGGEILERARQASPKS